jgi:nicotinate-nucleotide adenylyltransferase
MQGSSDPNLSGDVPFVAMRGVLDVMDAGSRTIFGGSFDPPHMGHQLACLYLLEAFETSAVWLVPVRAHPGGKSLAPFEHRLEMCRHLAAPFSGRVQVLNIESELSGGGRTYELLTHLRRRHPDALFRLALGSDVLEKASGWYRWEDVKRLAPIIPLARGGYAVGAAAPINLPEISSSEVRHRVALGRSIQGLVPRSILDYIHQHALYRLSPPKKMHRSKTDN